MATMMGVPGVCVDPVCGRHMATMNGTRGVCGRGLCVSVRPAVCSRALPASAGCFVFLPSGQPVSVSSLATLPVLDLAVLFSRVGFC